MNDKDILYSDDLLSSKKAAEYLGIARGNINRMVKEGRMKPALRTPGGHMRFEVGHLDKVKEELDAKKRKAKGS